MSLELKIGTRGSQLALEQAKKVADALSERFPEVNLSLVRIKTTGDKILDVPLSRIGGKGLFVKEIEEALLEGLIDLAVHSAKDVPIEIPPGLALEAFPPREDPRDVLVTQDGRTFWELPFQAKVGTSSLRRRAQLLYNRPDLEIVPLRGNVDTRLRKLKSESLDAIVVAAAGIRRLGLEDHITEYLPEDILLPAIGQGALGIEIRANDPFVRDVVRALDHPETHQAVAAERAFLRRLGGGCQVPLAAHGKVSDGRLSITGIVVSPDGKEMVRDSLEGDVAQAERLGISLAHRILALGGDRILREVFRHWRLNI